MSAMGGKRAFAVGGKHDAGGMGFRGHDDELRAFPQFLAIP